MRATYHHHIAQDKTSAHSAKDNKSDPASHTRHNEQSRRLRLYALLISTSAWAFSILLPATHDKNGLRSMMLPRRDGLTYTIDLLSLGTSHQIVYIGIPLRQPFELKPTIIC
jgi:hypothetical protein